MCNARSSKVKARAYHSCAAFEHDLALVVSNCRAYNEPESLYCTAATELERWGARLFEHLRNRDMLPPDDPTCSDDDESSSSASSEDEDEDAGHIVAGNSFVAPASVHAGMSAWGAHANVAGWRQSAAAFLHDQPSGVLPAGAKAAEGAVIAADLHFHGGRSSSSPENSSDYSDSSDGGAEDLNHAENGAPTSSSVASATRIVDHGLPRFKLGPKLGPN